MANIFQRIKARQDLVKKTKGNLPLFKGILAKKATPKKVVLPRATNPKSRLSTQKPNQDCACIRRQRNRAIVSRLKRELPEHKIKK